MANLANKKSKWIFFNVWMMQVLSLGKLITPFWTLVTSSMGFKARVDSLIPWDLKNPLLDSCNVYAPWLSPIAIFITSNARSFGCPIIFMDNTVRV